MQNVLDMDGSTRAAHAAACERIGERADATLLTRLERWWSDFHGPWTRLFGAHPAAERELARVLDVVAARHAARPAELRALDFEREITPDWFQRPGMVGYIAYADRFGGDLQGVRRRVGYLEELGVNYLHLMPLLRPREGPDDGGYAVADYRAVDPRLGTMEDLRALAGDLRARGIRLCLDLVLNHTAREHAWARAAMAGDAGRRAYYLTFADRELPDAYERTLPLVFPDFKPRNFTWEPALGRWVWTTFNDFQWDLDHSNPAVFREMLDVMLHLAEHGVDVLRLDAVPFMWKRLGTDCQNQPEVHDLVQAWRALVRMVAPAVAFKAEAIVAPQQLVAYLGVGAHAGRECDLAYHNSLMVLLWSALASRRAALMTQTLRAMPATPRAATWVTYVRCHDDIGWAITEDNAAAVGEDAHLHRRFLAEFYRGDFPGSFARGADFMPDPGGSGEARTSGMTASLAGLEEARRRGDGVAIEGSIRRILLLHAVIAGWGGIPLLYMGDEIGLGNDTGFRSDPDRAADERWLHRPAMDWEAAERRHDPASVEGRLFAGVRAILAARRSRPALHGAGPVQAVWTGSEQVFGWVREHGGERLLGVANVSEHAVALDGGLLAAHAMEGATCAAHAQAGRSPLRADGRLELEPYAWAWLTCPSRR